MQSSQIEVGAQSRTDEMQHSLMRFRRDEVIRSITLYCDSVKLADRMERDQIKNLEGLHRFTVLSKSTIPNAIIRMRLHPRESAGVAILNLITLLSDNNDGMCTLSIERMAELFGRTPRCIRETIDSLEEDGLLNIERINGFPNRYWPAVSASLADLSPAISWFVDALSTKPGARGRPTKTPERAFLTLSENPGTSVPPISEKTPEREGKNPGTSEHSISLRDISKRDSLVQTLEEQGELAAPKRAAARLKPSIDQFDRFWSVYPKRTGKAKALECFMALTPEKAEKAIVGAQRYAGEVATRGVEDRFIKMAQGWLNERRFEDIEDGADPNEGLVSPDGKKRWGWWRGKEEMLRAMTPDLWQGSLQHYKPNGTWPWWGLTAPPGHPECCLPEVLAAPLVSDWKGQLRREGH